MTTNDPIFDLADLSTAAAEFVKEYPREAQLAAVVALEVAARQFKVVAGQDDGDGHGMLRPLTDEE